MDKTIEILKDMVSSLKNSFRSQNQSSVHLSSESKEQIIAKLGAIKGVYGLPKKFLDDQFFEAYYRAFTLSDANDDNESFGYWSSWLYCGT
jgi:predicted metalloendopeptidase